MALFALPLAAAILTKSLLGLLPLLVLAVAVAAMPAFRGFVRSPWTWIGVGGGLALAASWTIHQGWTFGMEALREHYLAEVGPRTMTSVDPWKLLLGYPQQLMDSYQPVIIPALFGAFVLWRNRSTRGETGLLLPIWAFVPVVALNVLSGRTPRYIFPIFPALALCAGFWLAHVAPALALLLRRWVAPVLLVAGAIVLWTTPDVLIPLFQSADDKNREIKASQVRLRELMPTGEPVAFFGGQYWLKASPLLYYTDRLLEPAAPTVSQALLRATGRPSRLLLWDRDKLGQIDRATTPYSVVFEARDWVLLRLL